MYKLILLGLAYCSLCSSKTLQLKGGKDLDWGKNSKLIDKIRGRALTCKDGQFYGQAELFGIFEPIIEECMREIDSQDKLIFPKAGICMMNAMGLMDPEGAPDPDKMDAIYQVIYAPELLQQVPALTRSLHSCTKGYVDDYDNVVSMGKRGDIYEIFMVYNSCVDTTTSKLLHTIEKVCSTVKTL